MFIGLRIPTLSRRLYSDIKYSNLQIEKALTTKRNNYSQPFGFGKCFTDHMLEVHWDIDKGWSAPKIFPFKNLSVHPASKGIQYSFEAFEGLKSMRGFDNKIRIFRPGRHMERFHKSSQKLLLPAFDKEELLKCIAKLVEMEESWHLPPENNSFVYLRPTIIATDPYLGFDLPQKAMMYVIMALSETFPSSGRESVSMFVDVNNKLRTTGQFKLGTNYGPIVDSLLLAEKNNCHQCLWVYGDDYSITEASTVNFFALMVNKDGKRELVTPSLESGYLLPGVTRDSILQICRDMNEFTVSERNLSMLELLQVHSEGRLLEMFCTGTAITLKSIDKVIFGESTITAGVNQGVSDGLYHRLYNIMRGVGDKFSWNLII